MLSATIKKILKFRQLLGISPNEPITIQAINRSLTMLHENDEALTNYLNENEIDETVQLWQPTCTYKKNQFVVYIEDIPNSDESNVFILLSLISANDKKPVWVADENGLPYFDASGWKMIHNVTYLFQNRELLYNKIIKPQMEKSFNQHLNDAHGGMNVVNEDGLSEIFLRKDFTNTKSGELDPDGFVSFVDSDVGNGIIRRLYHKHMSGLLEIWITFSFNNYVNRYLTVEDDQYYNKKSKIFDEDDATIFSRFFYGDDEKLKTLHMKHNTQTPEWHDIKLGTNIFSREINFGNLPFNNTEYMMFTGPYLEDQFVFAESIDALQDASIYTPDQFVSEIMYVNKKPGSVTAVLPLHTYFNSYGAYKVGTIWNNQFTLHLIGTYR